MNDHANKDWLRTASYNAGALRQLSAGFALMVCVAAICAGLAVWGMWTGERDAAFRWQRAAEDGRRNTIAKCQKELGEHARAFVDQESGQVLCVNGAGGAR